MKKIKILMVGMDRTLGGIEMYLINLYRNIDKNKYDIFFLSFNDRKLYYYDEIKEKIINIHNRSKNYIQCLKDLKKLYQNENFDIIHFHLMSFTFFESILLAAKYSNAKLILHAHTNKLNKDTFKIRLTHFIGKILIKKYHFYYFACSKIAGEFMFSNMKVDNMIIAYNGIDTSKFKFNLKKRKIYRNKLGIKDNEILIGNVGRLIESKNHIYLLHILKKLNEYNNKIFKLLIIGSGVEYENLISYCKDNNLKENVIFLKNIPNVNDYMNAMDIFLYPSIIEGLGIVLIEAQTNGLTCIINKSLPNEINLTDKIIRLDIKDENIEEWINAVNNNLKNIRNDSIKNNIFDISNSINQIEKEYLRIYESINLNVRK